MSETEYKGMQAGRIPLWTRVAYYTVSNTIRPDPIPIEDRALGCDISKWNGAVDFAKMKNAGASFVYMKASQGTAILDSQYNNSRNNIAGILPFGSYHYMTTADGPTQAAWFVSCMGDNPGKLPPVVDVELQSVNASLIRQIATFIYDALHKYPIIYTSNYFWSKVTGTTDKAWVTSRCPLWVAHWATLSPLLPDGWTNYVVHQFSADGNGRGGEFGAPYGDSDMDLDYCRKSWLQSFFPPEEMECLPALVGWARRQPDPYTGPDPV